MKKILVPTDFSPCAENAVAVALEIAKKANSEIVFQHLFDDKSGSLHTLKSEAAKKEHTNQDVELGIAKAGLDALVNRAQNLGVTARPLLVMNRGTDKIENYIEPLQIGLVVMGSHGVTGMREIVIGSQTQRVVRHSSAPVLVVKHKPDPLVFNNVLFASTFEENPGPIFDKLVQFVNLWSGTIHLLYIGLDKDKQTKAMVEEKMNLLARQFPKARFTQNFITTNDPEWGIRHASKDIQPDAIAITTYLKTGVLMFAHSIAENLVNHEEIPVFVINTN